MKKRVLSGIRATGKLHLGNYLGAVKGMLELQDNPEYETLYMVADTHTITTPYDVEELRKNRREVVIDYLAAGLDPEKSIIFQQSEVPEHTELAFYFSSVVTIAKMQHLPTFKEKVKLHPQSSTMALLNYPILMTADILIYKAGLVPVGIDQIPHLEVAREIARRFNQDFGTDFPEPQRFKTEGEYIPSLIGAGKMSKSVEGSYINLTDDLDTIKSKISKIPTDSGKGEIKEFSPEPISNANIADFEQVHSNKQQAVNAVFTLAGLFLSAKRRKELENLYKTTGVRYSEIKQELSEAIYKELEPIKKRRKELEDNPGRVDKIIKEGNEKARGVARETVQEVKKKMGLA